VVIEMAGLWERLTGRQRRARKAERQAAEQAWAAEWQRQAREALQLRMDPGGAAVTVTRVRLSYVLVPTSVASGEAAESSGTSMAASSRGGPGPDGGVTGGALGDGDRDGDGRRVRLVVERDVVVVPDGQRGDPGAVLDLGERVAREQDRPVWLGPGKPAPHVVSLGEQFVDAASRYAGQRMGDDVDRVVLQRWQTRDAWGAETVANALGQLDGWLHGLVAQPVRGAAQAAGAPPPVAVTVGGIASELVLAQLDEQVRDATVFCEIVGIAVGLATGLHPLAVTCAKSLARTQVDAVLGQAARGVFSGQADITADPQWARTSSRQPGPPPVTRRAALDRPSPADLLKAADPPTRGRLGTEGRGKLGRGGRDERGRPGPGDRGGRDGR
jgi:hypothetical protein